MLVVQISKKEYQEILEHMLYARGFLIDGVKGKSEWALDMSKERLDKAIELFKNTRNTQENDYGKESTDGNSNT